MYVVHNALSDPLQERESWPAKAVARPVPRGTGGRDNPGFGMLIPDFLSFSNMYFT